MRHSFLSVLVLLAAAPVAHAQQPPTATTTQEARPAATETRKATVSVNGDTGLWFLPTAEVLPASKFSLSLYRANRDDGQGYTDVSHFPISVAFGLGNRAEIFGSWTAVTRIDRDSRPLFFGALEGH